MYRQRLHALSSINWNTFIELKRTDPEPGWEIGGVGLDIRNGQPYKMKARQKSYGFFLDGEEEYDLIDYPELSRETGEEINEKNWEEFIPEEKKKAFQKLSEPAPPIEVSRKDCIYNGKMTLNAYCVKTERAFGGDIVWFRKCGNEYRVFSYANARAGVKYLPMDMPPNEDQIERLFLHGSSADIYERTLSADEVSWFYKQYFTKEEKDAELWNDMYGGTYTYTFTDGPIRSESQTQGVNTRFTSRMQQALSKLARNGLKVID